MRAPSLCRWDASSRPVAAAGLPRQESNGASSMGETAGQSVSFRTHRRGELFHGAAAAAKSFRWFATGPGCRAPFADLRENAYARLRPPTRACPGALPVPEVPRSSSYSPSGATPYRFCPLNRRCGSGSMALPTVRRTPSLRSAIPARHGSRPGRPWPGVADPRSGQRLRGAHTAPIGPSRPTAVCGSYTSAQAMPSRAAAPSVRVLSFS